MNFKNQKLALIGLGYVGLPLAVEFGKVRPVLGFDVNDDRIAELRAGVQEKQLWSREMSVKALVQAFREGTGSVKVAAVKELNAMHGYNEPAKLNINGAMVHEVRRLIVDPNAS